MMKRMTAVAVAGQERTTLTRCMLLDTTTAHPMRLLMQ